MSFFSDWWNASLGLAAKAGNPTAQYVLAVPKTVDDLVSTLKSDAALIGIVGVTAVAFGLSAFGHRNGD